MRWEAISGPPAGAPGRRPRNVKEGFWYLHEILDQAGFSKDPCLDRARNQISHIWFSLGFIGRLIRYTRKHQEGRNTCVVDLWCDDTIQL
eukprot:209461-Prorocentrum_minimum.AAC.1